MRWILRPPLTIVTLVALVGMAFPSHATIYGDDDLVDVLVKGDPAVTELSRSVAVQIRNGSIRFDRPFMSRTLKSTWVCSDERFIHQPSTSTCTGALIGPKHILTAGHCLGGYTSACQETSWVFDFIVKNENATNFRGKRDNVYKCARIVSNSYFDKLDYAIIELDREVEGRKPLALDRSGLVSVGQRVFSIHSPRGLPLKHSSGYVRDASEKNHLTTTVDLMRGSSGAPIFDEYTRKIIGIVAQGDHDYELKEEPFCNAYKRCPENGCRGEDATRIEKVPVDFLSSIAAE